jgi:hypothetical protein
MSPGAGRLRGVQRQPIVRGEGLPGWGERRMLGA